MVISSVILFLIGIAIISLKLPNTSSIVGVLFIFLAWYQYKISRYQQAVKDKEVDD